MSMVKAFSIVIVIAVVGWILSIAFMGLFL
jgi:hypothetical protein